MAVQSETQTPSSAPSSASDKPTWQSTVAARLSYLNGAVDSVLATIAPSLPTIPSPEDSPDGNPYIRSLLSSLEVKITECETAGVLLRKISTGEYTSTAVTSAFLKRAALAHKLSNCLTDILPEAALQRAKELDNYLATNGKVIGPLHGLPISLKDQFRVRDTETSLGYVSWLGKKETEESESWVVKRLRDMGAVVYAKTNVPTSLMALETNNNIYGYTLNGKNRNFSSAGSSGGEASLIALRGSILGLGSDVGASIRLPCGVSGLYGLKPSHGRLPYRGVSNSMEGHDTVPSVIGPMGHNTSDLRLLTQSILSQQPWLYDSKVVEIPWRASEEEDIISRAKDGKLVFGIMKSDGVVHPHPPVIRGVEAVAAALKAQGHEVIEWNPPSHAEGVFEILWNTFAADGGKDIHDTLSATGEPPVPEVAVSYGEKMGHLPVATVNDLWKLQKQKWEFQMRYLDYWNSTAQKTQSGRVVDAIIMPVYPSAGFEREKGVYFGYTGIMNTLDFSAAVVPVTEADESIDLVDSAYEPTGDLDKLVHETYNPTLFHGMPVAVQVVGRRLQEERVLALCDVVAEAIKQG